MYNPTPTTQNWITTRLGWVAYSVVWLTFASGHAALNLLADEPNYSRAILSAIYVNLPAALLGIPVVSLTYRLAARLKGTGAIAAHVLGAALYPAIWVLVVNLIFTVRGVILGQGVSFRTPPADVLHWHGIAGVLIYASIVSVTLLAIEQRRRNDERQQAQLDLLLAKFDPHFLFNTLHSVRVLVGKDAVRAATALDQLADLLRRVLQTGDESNALVPLRGELRFCRQFLELEKLRLGDRLQIEEAIAEEALDCLIPPFSLQPIVENAIRHAIAPNPDGGVVRFTAKIHGDCLRISIADTGGKAHDACSSVRPGIGLEYVRHRVAAALGQVDVSDREGEGRIVTLSFPLRSER